MHDHLKDYILKTCNAHIFYIKKISDVEFFYLVLSFFAAENRAKFMTKIAMLTLISRHFVQTQYFAKRALSSTNVTNKI